jgi:hypothetical protein
VVREFVDDDVAAIAGNRRILKPEVMPVRASGK